MIRLNEQVRIEVLIMCGYGDKSRTQEQVCESWNDKYPDQRITPFTLSRIGGKFREQCHLSGILPKIILPLARG